MCLISVRESARPITYAPIIIAKPMLSKKPARISDKPNAIVAITVGERNANLRNLAIRRAARTPMIVAPSQTPNDLSATKPICPQSIEASAAPAPALLRLAAIIPLPIARTTRPKTSSTTAPAIIVVPSSESSFLRSERMRAVIPTDVAVDIIPI